MITHKFVSEFTESELPRSARVFTGTKTKALEIAKTPPSFPHDSVAIVRKEPWGDWSVYMAVADNDR